MPTILGRELNYTQDPQPSDAPFGARERQSYSCGQRCSVRSLHGGACKAYILTTTEASTDSSPARFNLSSASVCSASCVKLRLRATLLHSTQPQYVHALASCAHSCKYKNSALCDTLESFLPEYGSVPAGRSPVLAQTNSLCHATIYLKDVRAFLNRQYGGNMCRLLGVYETHTRKDAAYRCSDRCSELLASARLFPLK